MSSTYTLYTVAWLTMSVIPGPVMLLALTNGMSKNKRLVAAGIWGANLASIILISAVAIGLGALLAASEALFSLVKWGGVVYLLWLAWKLWSTTPTALTVSEVTKTVQAPHAQTPMGAFMRSLMVTASNPKGMLFFSAFLPQFITTNAPIAPQYLTLAVITIVVDSLMMLCYATGGVQITRLLTFSGLQRLNRGCAVFMACLAGGLALYRKV